MSKHMFDGIESKHAWCHAGADVEARGTAGKINNRDLSLVTQDDIGMDQAVVQRYRLASCRKCFL